MCFKVFLILSGFLPRIFWLIYHKDVFQKTQIFEYLDATEAQNSYSVLQALQVRASLEVVAQAAVVRPRRGGHNFQKSFPHATSHGAWQKFVL